MLLVLTAKQKKFFKLDVRLGNGRGSRPPKREGWPHANRSVLETVGEFSEHSDSQDGIRAHVSDFPHPNPALFAGGWIYLHNSLVAEY